MLQWRASSQDGEIGHRIHLSLQVHQGYVYKWKFLTEHLLNISGRLGYLTGQEKSPHNRVGKRQTERRNPKGQHNLGEAEGKERFLHQEKSPHGGGSQLDKTATLGDHWN